MEQYFHLIPFYYASLYFIFILVIMKGYNKTILEIVLNILPMFLFIECVRNEPWKVMSFVAIEFIVMNVFLLINVILIKMASFRILVSITQNRFLSKILCKMFDKKALCKELKRLIDIDYGQKLKLGIPAMVGKQDKKTKVKFDRNGFPKFKVFYTIRLRQPDYKKSREHHFNYANKILYKKAIKSKKIRKFFTKAEMEELKKGETPNRYTWHHHQDNGKLQLVSRKIHAKVNHIGGYSLWGGEKK